MKTFMLTFTDLDISKHSVVIRKHCLFPAPAVVLLNVDGIAVSLDPVIQDWLSYKPISKVTQTKELKVELNLELAKAASPLQTNMSQGRATLTLINRLRPLKVDSRFYFSEMYIKNKVSLYLVWSAVILFYQSILIVEPDQIAKFANYLIPGNQKVLAPCFQTLF